jgi:hypothetical protein
MKKTIVLVNYEGHQYDPTYATGWSDTWAEFHLGRKRISIGPTLVSMSYLDRDREMFGAEPEKYGYKEPEFPEGGWKFCLPFGDDLTRGIPTIAINADGVTKAGIEGAIGWYIRQRYGVTSEFRFRWRKNKSKLFITPW